MKERTLNEYRQTKEYYMEPVKRIMAQQIDEELEREDPSKYGGEFKDVEFDDLETPEEIQKIQEELEYKNDLEQAKEAIVEKITKQFDDVLFEMVCKEMSNNYLFQSQNYLTEAGYDMFEDEWFEFYHEHHADILYQLRQTVFE